MPRNYFETTEDEFGLSPFTKAVHFDQLTASKALISRGANVQGPMLLLYLQKIEEMVRSPENDNVDDNKKHTSRYPRRTLNG